MSRPIQLESLRAMLCKWLPGVAPSMPLLPAATGAPRQPWRTETTAARGAPLAGDKASRVP